MKKTEGNLNENEKMVCCPFAPVKRKEAASVPENI